MEIISIMLIAVSLAMDAFAVSISNGISVTGFKQKHAIKQGIFFGGFQFIMPVLGWVLGSSVKVYIEAVDHWIAFLLLFAIGFNMIKESLSNDDDEEVVCCLTNTKLIWQAIATSIDALAIGISLAILNVNIIMAATIIGVVAFGFGVAGGVLGKRLGNVFQQKAEIAGGIVLICIGLKILVEHIFL